MSDAVIRAAEVLKGHRESIDRLDAIMIYTLGERFKHTQAVGILKDKALKFRNLVDDYENQL
jgi:chorismate mutase